MGNLCCKKKTKRKIVLLLVGLDNAGKTVAAKGLAGEVPNADQVVPTVGFSIINLRYLSYLVKIFDLGGGSNIRGIWHQYFVDAHGVIFVVDSSDTGRLDEAKHVLQDLLSHRKIAGKPLLLLSNKQDSQHALDDIDIIEKLDLEMIVNRNECPTLVQSCSAKETTTNKSDPGVQKGYRWLLSYIARNYDALNKRVAADVYEQTQRDNRLRWEKIENLREMKAKEWRANDDDIDAIESYSDYKRKMTKNENGVIDKNVSCCYQKPDNEIVFERPKSAVEIVRQHLVTLSDDGNNSRRSPFVSRASNKTTPMCLYGAEMPLSLVPPRSATIHRDNEVEVVESRRRLKSAGDKADKGFKFTRMTHFSSSSDGDTVRQELIEMSCFHDNNCRSNNDVMIENKTMSNNGNVINDISVISVD